jgi:hypothetical protein
MTPNDKASSDKVPDEIRTMRGRTDFGWLPQMLPVPLAEHYFVESFYEDSVVKLLEELPARKDLLIEAVPVLHQFFGCDARLMLGALWSLAEPIGPVLHVVIYTITTRTEAEAKYSEFTRAWLAGRDAHGIKFVPTAIRAEELAGAVHRPNKIE